MQHELKSWPSVFEHSWRCLKLFEIRFNDRDYKIGDTIIMREWSPVDGYTGRAVVGEIGYIFDRTPPNSVPRPWDDGLAPGWVILQIENWQRFPLYVPEPVPREAVGAGHDESPGC